MANSPHDAGSERAELVKKGGRIMGRAEHFVAFFARSSKARVAWRCPPVAALGAQWPRSGSGQRRQPVWQRSGWHQAAAGNLTNLLCYQYRLPPKTRPHATTISVRRDGNTAFILCPFSYSLIDFTHCPQYLGVLPASFFLPRILNGRTFNPSNTNPRNSQLPADNFTKACKKTV